MEMKRGRDGFRELGVGSHNVALLASGAEVVEHGAAFFPYITYIFLNHSVMNAQYKCLLEHDY